jgi:NAD(P)-dependent dehydrogenase (short-subunit alcohol dehydrogenase family)
MGRLDGRAALITGASSGIGEATAQAFVREGAQVALVARRREQLERLAASLGDGAAAIAADVSDPAAAAGAVQDAASQFGRLDVVVNSAGIVRPLSLADLDAQAWRETIETNLSGSFYVAREAGLHMVDNGGGAIINLGSDLSILGMPMYVAYCTSKAGVIGLTKALAAELAPKVRVNAVCPGPVDTPMLEAEFNCFPDPKAAHDVTLERLPLKRFATADEVAGAVLYLAADASYATGTTLEFDGGSTFV